MTDTARITITLPLALKQALVERAQRTGQSQTQVVIQALERLLAAEDPPTLDTLAARIEQLESQMRSLMESGASPSGSVPTAPPPPQTSASAATSGSTSVPTQPTDPNLWDPVEHSFDDWLFQIWRRTAVDQTGHPLPWGHPLSVEQIHRVAFYELRYRRFIDRLLASEAPGLHLLPDETSQLGLGDCRPGAITFEDWDPQPDSASDSDHDPDRDSDRNGSNGHGSSPPRLGLGSVDRPDPSVEP